MISAVDASPHFRIGTAFVFFLNDTAPTDTYTLPLHAALPTPNTLPAGTLSSSRIGSSIAPAGPSIRTRSPSSRPRGSASRSEEHTSELQSRLHLVCRLLLEKKKSNLYFHLRENYVSRDFDRPN